MSKKIQLWILLCTLAGLPGCEFDTTTEITMVLYGQGGGFDGEYTIDDSSTSTTFAGKESTSNVFKYQSDIEFEDRIIVDVYPAPSGDDDETDLTGLTFRIFDEDGNIAYEDGYSISSTLMKTFTYKSGQTQTDI